MKKLYIEFSTDRELYLSYMPFLKEGGLFIRSSQTIELGTEVELEVLLPDSLEQSLVKGVVCWLTPVGAQNGTPPGIGISFVDDPDKIRYQIEKAIARHLNSSDPTLTM
ncbi:MAG: PilZ domain-containing protein [Colwellia sp.]|nr:PilZ domain-containing protein [Colwellia sp.]